MQFLDDSHYDTLLNENTLVTRPDGEPLLVLLKNIIPQETNALAWSVLKKYNAKTENRSTATGIAAEPRKRKDGTMSKVTRVPKGWEVNSGIVGFFERTVRMPYAHACAWNDKNPEQFAKLFPLVEQVNRLFRKHVPIRHRYQQAVADKTPREYLIGNSVFSTLTINKNYRTTAHKDAGDLPGGFSCMSVIRQGAFKGGRLVLPNWGIAAELETGDLIMFDPHEFHGNTQIVALTPDYVRCSIVYYFREKLQYCLPPREELRRAQTRKEGDSLFEKT